MNKVILHVRLVEIVRRAVHVRAAELGTSVSSYITALVKNDLRLREAGGAHAPTQPDGGAR